jgi:hypothetical protein
MPRVRRAPSHLPDAGEAGDTLHAQPAPKPANAEIRDHRGHGPQEQTLPFRRERVEFTHESSKLMMRGHRG